MTPDHLAALIAHHLATDTQDIFDFAKKSVPLDIPRLVFIACDEMWKAKGEIDEETIEKTVSIFHKISQKSLPIL